MINSIYKRGHTWWWQYRPHGARGKVRVQTLGTSDKCVAEKRRTELLTKLEQEAAGIIPPKSLREAAQKNLAKHLEDFLADSEKVGRSEKHLANLRHRAGVLITDCRWQEARDVTADSFQAWRSRQRLSAKTLNDYLEAARSLLNWMVRQERLLSNPLRRVEKIDLLGRETRIRRAFTNEELRLLIGSSPLDRGAIYLTAVLTGLRHSELGELQWGDIRLDIENPFVRVRASTTKNGKPITMHLHNDVVAALRAIRPKNFTEDEAVFPHMPRIERFRRDLKKAGVEYIDRLGRVGDFHSLRYTFGTNLAMAGVPSRVTMSLMRHSDRRLTDKIYTDEGLLSTVPGIEALPSVTSGLSQILSQICDTKRLGVTSPVTDSAQGNIEQTIENKGDSRALARSDAPCREVELAGATGLETTPFCNFAQ